VIVGNQSGQLVTKVDQVRTAGVLCEPNSDSGQPKWTVGNQGGPGKDSWGPVWTR
jgi:hypothetical protein